MKWSLFKNIINASYVDWKIELNLFSMKCAYDYVFTRYCWAQQSLDLAEIHCRVAVFIDSKAYRIKSVYLSTTIAFKDELT